MVCKVCGKLLCMVQGCIYSYFGRGWNMGLIIYVEKLMSLGWFQKCYPIVEELLKVVKTYLHNLHISNLTKLPVI